MKRLPYLLLLPLLVVLLFGNCGGGVSSFLSRMGPAGRARFQEIIEHRQALRDSARHQLKGQAKREALWRIEDNTDARLHELLPDEYDQRKLHHRRNKIERQLHNEQPELRLGQKMGQ